MDIDRRRLLTTMPAWLSVLLTGGPSIALAKDLNKAGVGTWDIDSKSTALRDLKELGLAWYYDWQPQPLWSQAADWSIFTPMIWGPKHLTDENLRSVSRSPATALLGFNEPDEKLQANMTVEEALRVWPRLVATGKRLGSPAPSTQGLWWLDKFMAAGPKVDFIAVHHYSTNKEVAPMKAYLEDVYARYRKPVWLTEWALVDWTNPKRFSLQETAAYAQKACLMLEDLPFVERHAWFAMYPGGDGWHINTELLDSAGRMTAVGNVFAARKFLTRHSPVDRAAVVG